jgi:hypothetical protein
MIIVVFLNHGKTLQDFRRVTLEVGVARGSVHGYLWISP